MNLSFEDMLEKVMSRAKNENCLVCGRPSDGVHFSIRSKGDLDNFGIRYDVENIQQVLLSYPICHDCKENDVAIEIAIQNQFDKGNHHIFGFLPPEVE